MAVETVVLDYFDAEQDDFVALASSLREEQWATKSLCEGWTVRDAVLHAAWHIHFTPLSVAQEFSAYLVAEAKNGDWRFLRDFDSKVDRYLLARYGAISNERLVHWLGSPARRNANHLGELMIHQQDVRRPLGLAREIPADRLSWLLSYCMTSAGNRNAGHKPRDRAEGVRLVATDVDWSAGQGPEVRGPGEAILMTIAGRPGVIDELSGPGVAVLANRAP
jgi:uncharacterized protein (TIGR03083 family)